MKVLFIARSTLYTVYGGDTVQVENTAAGLRALGVEVDIKLTHEPMDYGPYQLLHFFNIIRPADILVHAQRSQTPYVVSTIYVDFSEYERTERRGFARLVTNLLSRDAVEYLKSLARWIRNGERIQSATYLLWGHRAAVRKVARHAALLLPNSHSEYHRLQQDYGIDTSYHVVYNGIDTRLFGREDVSVERNPLLVLCVARIEGKKNQLNLIRALNNTRFQLMIVGKPAPNHLSYNEACRREAAANIRFVDFVAQEHLVRYYQQAAVHVLASWNETCGLSSLEAAYNGCNLVITDKGDTREYFEDDAWYCDPSDPDSIRKAVESAAAAPFCERIRQRVQEKFNWPHAAEETWKAYKRVCGNSGEKTSG